MLMTKCTEVDIALIVRLLRDGAPLPKELREKIVFEDELDQAHKDNGKPPLHEHLRGLIGTELRRRGLFDEIRDVASSDIPVLIEGEKGTGKKLIAQTIHEMGSRGNGPFIMVDCSSLPDVMAESQLLGHIRGAFAGAMVEKTGLIEMADHGTIVLDEVDALPLKMQALLLRFLENNSIGRLGSSQQIAVDARVIATSHLDLNAVVTAGSFRDDLFLHLSAKTLSVPPLRERRDDILVLANFFHKKYAELKHTRIMGFSADALEALWHYKWPGNVTELENMIKRALVKVRSRKIRPEDLGLGTPIERIQHADKTLKNAREEWEKDRILQALSKNRDNITRTAEDLGVSRPTLYGLMEKLKISKP
jgi:DNA-binding NtrC family response regulator